MYRTCLFCNSDLGGNEALEHLQIGRRVAFDMAQGRLWVVCRKCERWNLTPFGDRFEAIEEGEKLFRDTKVRFSTDEIGLARLRDGTELVRIGEPLRPEFAAWRYGDQFGRRRLRHGVLVGLGIVGIAGLAVAPQLLGASIGGGGLYQLYRPILSAWRANRVVTRLDVPDGRRLPLTQKQVDRTELQTPPGSNEWQVLIAPRKMTNGILEGRELAVLAGQDGHRALQKLLPRINRAGAGKAKLRDAVEVLESTPTAEALAAWLGRSPASGWSSPFTETVSGNEYAGTRSLGSLHEEIRLALEMAVHEDAERRWLAGELLDLERAWRDAEELAAIADKLGVPEPVETQLGQLKAASRSKGEVPK